MNKLVIAIACVAFYLLYVQIKSINTYYSELKKDTLQILAVNAMLKDKFDIKDKEVQEKEFEVRKYAANYEAFNGTACMQCHLETKNLLPYKDKPELTLTQYTKVVREGIEGVMPSYINSPKKGARDITDSELRRQFKIINGLSKP